VDWVLRVLENRRNIAVATWLAKWHRKTADRLFSPHLHWLAHACSVSITSPTGSTVRGYGLAGNSARDSEARLRPTGEIGEGGVLVVAAKSAPARTHPMLSLLHPWA
jgi:hypothetical protein